MPAGKTKGESPRAGDSPSPIGSALFDKLGLQHLSVGHGPNQINAARQVVDIEGRLIFTTGYLTSAGIEDHDAVYLLGRAYYLTGTYPQAAVGCNRLYGRIAFDYIAIEPDVVDREHVAVGRRQTDGYVDVLSLIGAQVYTAGAGIVTVAPSSALNVSSSGTVPVSKS